MDTPAAVWVVELVNSAPVISHTGAVWTDSEERGRGRRMYKYMHLLSIGTTIIMESYLGIFDDKVRDEGLVDQQPGWYLGCTLNKEHTYMYT